MNKQVLLLVIGVILYQLAFQPIFAVKAYPFPINVTQPDGSQLTIRLHGDEFRHYQTTEDGYVLKQNANGYYTYATVSITGEINEGTIIAQNADKRSTLDVQYLTTVNKVVALSAIQAAPQKSRMLASSASSPRKAYPLNGSPKALVILANFKDKAFTVPTPQTAYQNLLTQTGYSANGGTGSAKDYFMASTYGKFAPDFVVIGPVTLPQNLAYYGVNTGGTAGNDTYPAQMIVDACKAADTAGLDFTQFDTDGDGYVDNVFVYYAGYNEAEGGAANTIWPHRWSISEAGITSGITFDGKKINDYSCTSELKGTTGTNMCGIGTFCHEFGHVIGLPDYYDTSGTQSNTLNEWDIMDYGAYSNGGCTPPAYSAYDRFFLGYLTPQQVSTPSDLTLLPLYQGTTQPANTDNQAFLFSATTHNLNGAAPSPAEFFLVEYRKQTGWDTYLPAEGMCIWHIDFLQSQWDVNKPNNYTGTKQTAGSHMRVYLQPLSGSTTTPGTAFITGSFAPTTWSGADINRAITSIAKATDKITFKLLGGVQGPTISTTGSLSAFSAIVGTPSAVQGIQLTGVALTANIEVSLVDKANYDIKLSSLNTWVKSLSITPTSGAVSETLQVRYNPSTAGVQTDQINFASAGATSQSLSLNGTATVPYDPNAPAIIVGKIENIIQFPVTKVNVSNTKAFNIRTTNISSALSLAVTGTDAALFTVSSSSLIKDAVNAAAGTNITVIYKPTAVGMHSATLTISGGGLNPEKVLTLQGEGQ
jgi:M6 family metalloprotease-like protein